MIDLTQQRQVFETYIDANFSLVPTVFENTKHQAEDGPHIAIEDSMISSTRLEMQSSKSLVVGEFTIEIYTNTGEGTKLAREIASELIQLVEDYSGSLMFSEPVFLSVGKVEGAKLYQHSLNVPYQYVYGQDDTNAC